MKYQTDNPGDRMDPAFTGGEIRYIENLNPKKEALTVEKLRMFSGCEHYNDEQAAEIVKTIHLIALVLYENRRSKSSLTIDNQLVVNLKREEKLSNPSQLKLKKQHEQHN